jgi:hypothetical protein
MDASLGEQANAEKFLVRGDLVAVPRLSQFQKTVAVRQREILNLGEAVRRSMPAAATVLLIWYDRSAFFGGFLPGRRFVKDHEIHKCHMQSILQT